MYNKDNYKKEIIDFIKKSSEDDNFIIATFIAGMQAKKINYSKKNINLKHENRPA